MQRTGGMEKELIRKMKNDGHTLTLSCIRGRCSRVINDSLKGLLQLVGRVPYCYHTVIVSIPKNRPPMPILPIVRDPQHN